MRFLKPMILSLIILSLAGGLAYAKNKMKYSGVDRNNDGVLSGDEVRPDARQQGNGLDRFSELDYNSNGFVSRGEWRGDPAALTRLDVNEDDLLTENEFYGRQSSSLIDIILQDIFRGR